MERVTVGATVAALCVGLMVGGMATYQLQPEKTPAACQRVAEAEVLGTTGKLMSAVTERANTAEWQRRSILAGKIDRLSSLLESQASAYDADRIECLEAS